MDITDATNHLRFSSFYHGRKASTSISNAITKATVGDAGFVRTLLESIKAQDAQVLGMNQKRIPHTASGQLSFRALFLGIPEKSRYGPARRPPRLSRLRPPHRIKRPEGLRRLARQSRFVTAYAVKQVRVKIGKAQESLGDGVRF